MDTRLLPSFSQIPTCRPSRFSSFSLNLCSSRLQDDLAKEFREEIRKLKTMIVKHENRIRALEARLTEVGENVENDKSHKEKVENHSSGDSSNNNVCPDKNANSSGDREELAPDEV